MLIVRFLVGDGFMYGLQVGDVARPEAKQLVDSFQLVAAPDKSGEEGHMGRRK